MAEKTPVKKLRAESLAGIRSRTLEFGSGKSGELTRLAVLAKLRDKDFIEKQVDNHDRVP